MTDYSIKPLAGRERGLLQVLPSFFFFLAKFATNTNYQKGPMKGSKKGKLFIQTLSKLENIYQGTLTQSESLPGTDQRWLCAE